VADCTGKGCGDDDDCGGVCTGDCPDGQICVANPTSTCEACSASNSLPDLCAPHDGVICGMANNIVPECWCVTSVDGAAVCTNFTHSLCNCSPDDPPCNIPANTPICTSDADCVARGYTYCIPAVQNNGAPTDCSHCNGGVACAIECNFV
jgi:hypothetical protein